MNSNLRKKLFHLLNIILTAGTFVFAYIYGSRLIKDINFNTLEINMWLVVGSLLFFLAFYGLLSLHWMLICEEVDKKSNSNQVFAFFASQPYKYLPTSLFTFSFRAKYAKDLGLGLKLSSIAQLIENFNILLSGTLIAVIFYLQYNYPILGLLIIIIASFILIVLYINNYNVRIPIVKLKISTKSASKYISLVSLAWVVSGFSFYLLGQAFGLDIGLFRSVASNAGAFISGILAFFAPGGIGVRELVFTAFGIQSLMIVLWRLLTFCVDIIVGILAILYIKFNLTTQN